jgi:hypothetical protein
MKTAKFLTFTLLLLTVFFVKQSSATAATFPLSGVNILLKSLSSGRVTVTSTDTYGTFNTQVSEEAGAYDIYINDESMPPIKISAKKNIVHGRIVILTDDTTTKEPEPLPVKKQASKVKKSTVPTRTHE